MRIALLARRLLRISLLGIALLPLRRAGLSLRRDSGHVGLCGLATRRGRRGAKLTQPILELAVTVLQFLVLAGQLPELLLEPLDPHFCVGVVGLRLALGGTLRRTFPRKRELCGRGLDGQSQHHGDRRGAGSVKESG